MVEPFDGSQDPHAHLQAFQAQMYISEGDDKLSCKLFPGTLKGVAMQWMATLPPRTIRTFSDLANAFTSQFAANKKKQLEVADLFDIRQAKEEGLKSYLARFNTATVRVNDPDQKFFIKAFQKGLRASPFSDSLALKRPSSMAEIRARAEKHIEVEEDQAERIVEEQAQSRKNEGRVTMPKTETSRRTEITHKDKHFTPLNEKRAQILREICHTRLPRFPPTSDGRMIVRLVRLPPHHGALNRSLLDLENPNRAAHPGGKAKSIRQYEETVDTGRGKQRQKTKSVKAEQPDPTQRSHLNHCWGSTSTFPKTQPAKKRSSDRVDRSECHPAGKTGIRAGHYLYKKGLQEARNRER
ncbi:hypothetical protein CR513_51431, partial [Mucuna pruriens]